MESTATGGIFAEHGVFRSVGQSDWRITDEWCDDLIQLTSRQYAEGDTSGISMETPLRGERASIGGRSLAFADKGSNRSSSRSQVNDSRQRTELSPTNPFRNDIELEWSEGRKHDSQFDYKRPRNPQESFHLHHPEIGQMERQPTKNQSGLSGTYGIRPGIYDGSSSWEDYQVQFEAVAELHGWDKQEMAMCLAASLKGDARAVLADLHAKSRRSNPLLTEALSRRFSPSHQTEIFRIQLKNRIRKKEESLPQLAQEVRRLARQAYPSAPPQLLGFLCKDHLLDALDDQDLRLGVYHMGPGSLEEALKAALEMEAFHTAEKQRNFSGRRVVRASEGKAIKSESETTGLCMTATEGIKQCRLSMAELQSEIKAVRSELQLMKDERKQYSSQGKIGTAAEQSKVASGNDRKSEMGVALRQ
ncbi:hypothetical protein HOLleu_03295 [Holothuria leucospilota]|uniref:Uncharacterized protein n=1 Tax=Holothuria leucospilota TaxID=206669 RepID=A0A9Q1CQM4_HOLLE|nr:hypothetical protein HOLleu_03295 [Holothuria leucospilota]